MDDRGPHADTERRLDRWLQEEVEVPAPDRILEAVFARTETAHQSRRGSFVGWLRLGRSSSPAGSRGWSRRAAAGSVAIVAVAVGVGALGGRFAAGPGAAPASSGPHGSQLMDAVRTHTTCAREGSLVVLPAKPGGRASAWVTCGADSEEIVLGSDTVTRRDGLGFVATDGTTDWAIQGNSAVQLRADRTIARTVPIGTPASIAVGGGAVWVLDTRTGELRSIDSTGVARSVVPAANGRPISIAIAAGSLWVLDQAGAQLLRRDLRDGHLLLAIPVAEGPTILAAAAGALYVASPPISTIVRINPGTGQATTLRPDLGRDGHIDALGGSQDGLVLGSRTSVHRLDPLTGVLSPALDVGRYLAGVGLDGSTVVALAGDGTVTEIGLP